METRIWAATQRGSEEAVRRRRSPRISLRGLRRRRRIDGCLWNLRRESGEQPDQGRGGEEERTRTAFLL